MKNIVLIGLKAFLSFTIIFTFVITVTFTIYFGEFIIPFKYSTLAAVFIGFSGALSVILGHVLFQKRIFFYGNIETELEGRCVKNIIFEGIAANTTFRRIRYGSLFLTDKYVLFIPTRFAIKPRFITLSLEKIKQVAKSRINPLKFFLDGLKRRLSIETIEGERYEFIVWELNKWIKHINNAKDELMESRRRET